MGIVSHGEIARQSLRGRIYYLQTELPISTF